MSCFVVGLKITDPHRLPENEHTPCTFEITVQSTEPREVDILLSIHSNPSVTFKATGGYTEKLLAVPVREGLTHLKHTAVVVNDPPPDHTVGFNVRIANSHDFGANDNLRVD